MSCDIIIPVWNKKELTQNCIESIIRNTQYPYRIITIDNASQSPAKEYLESLESDKRFDFILVRNEENLGNTKAVNQGIEKSNAEFICILDNDTVVGKGWLIEMVSIAQANKDVGIVNPCSNTLAKWPKSSSPADIDECAEDCLKRRGQYLVLGACIGFCTLVKREVIDKIGGWDEIFSPGYFDDTDYSLRAEAVGYKSVCARGAYVYHSEHASFKNKNLERYFKRGRDLFHQRYGKPKRLLYIISRESPDYYELVRQNSYALAARGNWVWIFLKSSLPALGMEKHANIRHFSLPSSFFIFKSIWKILKRQKKKFDEIYLDDERAAGFLKGLAFIHRAKVGKV